MADRSRTTKTSRGNRGPTPTDTDHPVDQPSVPTDSDADTIVVVAHWHGHTPDLHGRGGDPHYQREDGQNEYGTWEPPGTLPYEYLGDQPDAHPDDHRHQNTAVSNHETGRESHRHAPIGGGRLPLEASDPEAVTVQSVRSGVMPGIAHKVPAPPPVEVTPGTTYTAEVKASQARHPSGHEATDNGLPDPADLTPEQIHRLKAYHRRSLNSLDDSAPTPDRIPAVIAPAGGASQPGATIADPVAESAMNTLRFHRITDPMLQHEMNWAGILTRAVLQLHTYHADDRADGGAGPQLAPGDLIGAIGDAYEQIRQPRLAAAAAAREAYP